VFSYDYGELGLAMLFLRGQRVLQRTALALTDRLHADHSDIVPRATHAYSSVGDILELVATHRANIVLLFSGYLLANGQVLSHELLGELVDGLRARGCTVVTTDPFLGLASRLRRGHIGREVPYDPAGTEKVRARVAEGLVRASEILEPAVHLYHRAPGTWLSQQRSRSVTFFNAPEARDAATSPKRRWLFVLGTEDVALQQRLIRRRESGGPADDEAGPLEFAGVVARLLERTAGEGRMPMLIAPPKLLDALPAGLKASCDVRPFCAFPEFHRAVLESEYVFYWNVFSASMLTRLDLRLPTFFFDRGHMARIVVPLYELGLLLHFGGWKPDFLDQNAALDAEDLERRWNVRGLGNSDLLEVWRKASPSPDELLEQLVNE
jgi:hypothetical protein